MRVASMHSWRIGAGIAALALGAFGALDARASIGLTFDTSSDYTNNFRLVYGSAVPTVSSGYLSLPFGAGTMIYDTTPADATVKSTFTVTPGTPLTVSVSWLASTDLSSVGLYIIDPNNENTTTPSSYLSLVNINSNTAGAAATTERFRFWGDVANPVGQSIGTTTSYDVAVDAGIADGEWNTLTWTYSINTSGQAVVDTTVNGVTEEAIVNSGLTTLELGLRMSSRGGTYGIDNFTIAQSAVPEPASLGILGFSGLLMLWRRSKKS